MPAPALSVVTGAFSYSGKYIARELLAAGMKVRTLTRHPERPNPFGNAIEVAALNFDNPLELAESLRGATTLYNTYWVRFPFGQVTFETAVANTKRLILAAEQAGVRRIVHLSVSNPSEDSPLPYFRGKAALEKAIMKSSLSYAIIRPTLIFGTEDILINNIAWLLRHFPVFAIPGSGDYRLQPISAEDLAALAVRASSQDDNLIVDAAGPETYTYDELVRLVAQKIGRRARLMHLRPGLVVFLARLLRFVVNDVLLTPGEVEGLMSGLLVSNQPPAGQTRFSEWLERNAENLGTSYSSELDRHWR